VTPIAGVAWSAAPTGSKLCLQPISLVERLVKLDDVVPGLSRVNRDLSLNVVEALPNLAALAVRVGVSDGNDDGNSASGA
jgi:hypothetical protein